MTADERLESLLNRAGQTISDLPGDYETAKLRGIADVIHDWRPYDPNDGPKAILDAYRKYILHLTDIIDRMETALENVCGERDYLAKRFSEMDCDCTLCMFSEMSNDEAPCLYCDLPPRADGVKFVFAGLPDDWRVDDEQ